VQRSAFRTVTEVGLVFGLASLYFAAAKLGLALAVVSEQVSLVWPPSGIALAAVLLFGYRVWPGIFLGALLANATSAESLVGAFFIAGGNTLEAVIAVSLLARMGFNARLSRLRDALAFVLLASFLSTTIAATVGSLSLVATGVEPWSSLSRLWRDWWIGDAVGDLTIAPALLVLRASGRFQKPTVGALLLALGAVLVSVIVFAQPSSSMMSDYPLHYLVFPFVAWGALRFGVKGSSLVVVAVAAVAIASTAEGLGPFVAYGQEEPLLLLQLFIAVMAVTGLLLGAAVTERDEAHESLKLQDQRKDQFLATLAHELRNPLAPIVAAAHVLRAKAGDAVAARRLEQVLSRQLAHLTRLVDDLLDMSRITSGKVKLERAPVDLSDVVHAALEMSGPLTESREIELEADLASEVVVVNGDFTRLVQVVFNLLSNAVRYGKDKGHIWLRLSANEREAILTVRDDGVGMSEEVIEHAFELFAQGPGTGRGAGLGIGLTLVRQLVELHDGQVSAQSPGVGAGSEFEVRLPRLHVALERGADSTPDGAKGLSGDRPREVLVVDDNVDAAVTLARLVELRGHHVEIAHDGATALERVRTYVPDVILLDIEMPEMNGYEVARAVRSDERLRAVRLIAITGYGKGSDRERATQAGFDAHMIKPVEPDALYAALESG
jgi:signal transduction histidine kinase/CheY-like chemotaxis protein